MSKTDKKWTHITEFHERCCVILDKPDLKDHIVVEVENSGYDTVRAKTLKSIIPELDARDIKVLQQFYSWCIQNGKMTGFRNVIQEFIDGHT